MCTSEHSKDFHCCNSTADFSGKSTISQGEVSIPSEKDYGNGKISVRAFFVGMVSEAVEFLKIVRELGPKYGFHVNYGKCNILFKPGVILEQSNYFTDIGTNITEESIGLLGSFIGIDSFVYKNVSKKISKWMTILERLAEIAISDPQVAYCAYVFSLQHRWTLLIRTCKCKGEWFNNMEDILSTKVLTSITGLREISDLRRFIFQLPIKHGGLGLLNIKERAVYEYERSYRMTQPLDEYHSMKEVKVLQDRISKQINEEFTNRTKFNISSIMDKVDNVSKNFTICFRKSILVFAILSFGDECAKVATAELFVQQNKMLELFSKRLKAAKENQNKLMEALMRQVLRA
ncbi:hypothetical protein GJ496_000594 [Pomphorhynchus laevis]|nr:hypothetical protein GJ496_000594 [Pomphorhynchus laevis]